MIQSVFFAIAGGFLPPLIWLWFWLREDSAHPEPRRLISLAFLGGMIAVPLVLPFQKFVYDQGLNTITTFILWVIIEEVLKFVVAYITVLRRIDDDEPLDPVIYMIIVALGFASIENVFFVLDPLQQGLFASSIITSNLRFIGATLLHVIASASVGIFMAFSFYDKKFIRILYSALGLMVAIALHTFFNLSIIGGNGERTLVTFYSVWFGIVVLMLIFERIKLIRPNKL